MLKKNLFFLLTCLLALETLEASMLTRLKRNLAECSNCVQIGCDLDFDAECQLKWRPYLNVNRSVEFELRLTSSSQWSMKWLAIGFNTIQSMSGTSVVMIYLPAEGDFTMFNGKIDSYTPPEASRVNQLTNVNARFVDQYKYISFEIAQSLLDESSIDLSKCNYATVASGFLSRSNNVFRAHMHTKTPMFTSTCQKIANELDTTTTTASSTTTSTVFESTTISSSTLTSETISVFETTTAASIVTSTSPTIITPLNKFKFRMRLNYTFDDKLNNFKSDSHKLLTNSILEFCQNALLESKLALFTFYNVGIYKPGSVLVDWDLYFDSIHAEPFEFQSQLNIIFNNYAKTYSALDIFTDSIKITYEETQSSSTTTASPLNDVRFIFEMKVSSNFSHDLFDSNSDEFKKLTSAIETIVLDALAISNISEGYKGLKLLNLTSDFKIDLFLTFDEMVRTKYENFQALLFSSIWNYIKDKNLTITIDLSSIHLFQLINDTKIGYSTSTLWTSTTSTSTASYIENESKTDDFPIFSNTNSTLYELINVKKDIQPVAVSNDLRFKMKLTTDYLPNYNDSSSFEYKDLADKIKTELSKAFNKSNITSFSSLQINSFKPGSILVDSTLSFNKQIDATTVQNALKSHFASSNLLNVDINSIGVSQNSSDSGASSSSSSNDGIIAAIVVPIGIFVILLGVGSFILFKRYKKKKMKTAVKVNEDTTFRSPLNAYDHVSKNKLGETQKEDDLQQNFRMTTVVNEKKEEDERSLKTFSKSDKISLQENSIDIMKSDSFNQRLEEMGTSKLAKFKISESNETLNESKINEMEDLNETKEQEETSENKFEKEDNDDLEEQTEKDDEDSSSEKSLDFSKADEALRQAAREAKEEEKPQIVNRFDILPPEADKMSESLQDSLPNQYFESKLPESETIAITNANQLVDDDISDTGTEDNYSNKDDEESEEEESDNDEGKTIHI